MCADRAYYRHTRARPWPLLWLALSLACTDTRRRDRRVREIKRKLPRATKPNQTGWLEFRSAWFGELADGGPRAWFRWVFLDLEQHEPDCRWRRTVEWLRT